MFGLIFLSLPAAVIATVMTGSSTAGLFTFWGVVILAFLGAGSEGSAAASRESDK